jgi:hypothetical protein
MAVRLNLSINLHSGKLSIAGAAITQEKSQRVNAGFSLDAIMKMAAALYSLELRTRCRISRVGITLFFGCFKADDEQQVENRHCCRNDRGHP